MKISFPVKAGILGGLSSAILVLIVLSFFQFKPVETLLISSLVLLISFLVIFVIVRQFLYLRLKQLYGIIYEQDKLRIEKKVQSNLQHQKPLKNVDKNIREWAERNTLQIQNLKMMSRYRQEFLGNVSHELKTPIFNIQGYLSTLIDGAWKDKSVAKKFMRKALSSADRLENLVQDLTSIAELESGREKLTALEFDIEKLILDIFESLEMKARKKNIDLRIERKPLILEKVIADEHMIHQVLTNLLENSIKYGIEDGKTWVNLVDIENKLWVEVCDNGEGIAEEHHSRLFERFYRTDAARSRNLGGTGLGLAIVKHIVEAHGEQINVSSTVGIGSTFSFSLKKAEEHEGALG